jgi:hypothetical protein
MRRWCLSNGTRLEIDRRCNCSSPDFACAENVARGLFVGGPSTGPDKAGIPMRRDSGRTDVGACGADVVPERAFDRLRPNGWGAIGSNVVSGRAFNVLRLNE